MRLVSDDRTGAELSNAELMAMALRATRELPATVEAEVTDPR